MVGKAEIDYDKGNGNKYMPSSSTSLLDSKGELHAYYHTDYLGTTDYLTSAVNSKVISWTNYNEWGEITHNAVLKCGVRELDLVKEYATRDYDSVLQMYYAKARMYDAYNRRFTAVDPILDGAGYDLKAYVATPMALNQYLYVWNNAVNWIDPLGLYYVKEISKSEYAAVPEKTSNALLSSIISSIPGPSGEFGSTIKIWGSATSVGGNSQCGQSCL